MPQGGQSVALRSPSNSRFLSSHHEYVGTHGPVHDHMSRVPSERGCMACARILKQHTAPLWLARHTNGAAPFFPTRAKKLAGSETKDRLEISSYKPRPVEPPLVPTAGLHDMHWHGRRVHCQA